MRVVWNIVFAVVALDMMSKFLVVKLLEPLGETVPLIRDVLHLTYVENSGAAFGILKEHRWVFLIASVAAIVLILWMLKKNKITNKLFLVSLSMILGGGIGNMIDRMAIGYVVDFIDFRLIDFAVFNVADSAISIGAVLLVVYIVFFEIKGLKNGKARSAH